MLVFIQSKNCFTLIKQRVKCKDLLLLVTESELHSTHRIQSVCPTAGVLLALFLTDFCIFCSEKTLIMKDSDFPQQVVPVFNCPQNHKNNRLQ